MPRVGRGCNSGAVTSARSLRHGRVGCVAVNPDRCPLRLRSLFYQVEAVGASGSGLGISAEPRLSPMFCS